MLLDIEAPLITQATLSRSKRAIQSKVPHKSSGDKRRLHVFNALSTS